MARKKRKVKNPEIEPIILAVMKGWATNIIFQKVRAGQKNTPKIIRMVSKQIKAVEELIAVCDEVESAEGHIVYALKL